MGAVGSGEEEGEGGARPMREAGPRGEEGMREEITGRLSRAVLDELGEPLLFPVSVCGYCECVSVVMYAGRECECEG